MKKRQMFDADHEPSRLLPEDIRAWGSEGEAKPCRP
jgi:hypothetical protein